MDKTITTYTLHKFRPGRRAYIGQELFTGADRGEALEFACRLRLWALVLVTHYDTILRTSEVEDPLVVQEERAAVLQRKSLAVPFTERPEVEVDEYSYEVVDVRLSASGVGRRLVWSINAVPKAMKALDELGDLDALEDEAWVQVYGERSPLVCRENTMLLPRLEEAVDDLLNARVHDLLILEREGSHGH